MSWTPSPALTLSFSLPLLVSPAKVLQHNVEIKLVGTERDWNTDGAGVGIEVISVAGVFRRVGVVG